MRHTWHLMTGAFSAPAPPRLCGLEGWIRRPPWWIRLLGEAVWWVGGVLLGAAIAVGMMMLHRGGWTP